MAWHRDLVDVERLAVKLVAGLEFPVHLFGEVMVTGVNIILVADHDDVIRPPLAQQDETCVRCVS